jgi:hypothetical protein
MNTWRFSFPLSILHSWKLCMSFPFTERVLLQLGMISAPISAFQEAVHEFSVP